MTNLPDLPENRARNAEWIKKQNDVFDEYVRGNQNYTELARKFNLKRAEVITMINEVNAYMRESKAFKEMAKERLGQIDHHWNMLIKESWEAVDELKQSGKYDKVPASLKIISEIEGKRQELLQKAGMYDDYEMGDMLAESERKIDAVKELLKQVIAQFPGSKAMIIEGLKKIENPDRLPEPEIIDKDIVDGEVIN